MDKAWKIFPKTVAGIPDKITEIEKGFIYK